MYNRERKQAFIDSREWSSRSRVNLHNIFEVCEGFEKALQKDLAEFSQEEYNEIFSDGLSITTRRSAEIYSEIFDKYFAWCAANGYTVSEHISLRDTPDPVKGVQDRMFSSPLDLQSTLDLVFEPENPELSESIYRAFLWTCFAGIPPEAAAKLRVKDVNFDLMMIRYYNPNTDEVELLPIYREAIASLKACCTRSGFRYPTRSGLSEIKPRAGDGTYAFSPVLRSDKIDASGVPSFTTLKQTVNRAARIARDKNGSKIGGKDVRLAPLAVYRSGVFYALYEAEVSFDAKQFKSICQKEVQRGTTTTGKNVWRRRGEMMSDYELWKSVFRKK